MKSPQRTARIAGLLYLAIFITVPLSFMIGAAGVMTPGDAAVAAGDVLASESLFRLGMVAESAVFLIEVLLAGLLFALLKPVNEGLSLAAALARLGEGVIQAANLFTSALVLLLVGGGAYLSAFDPQQLGGLAVLFLKAHEYGILLWGIFFGFHLLLLGYLVYKSGYFPAILGILLILGGFGYLLESWGKILLPQYEGLFATIVIVLAVPSELAFSIWLLWKGVKLDAWQRQVADAA